MSGWDTKWIGQQKCEWTNGKMWVKGNDWLNEWEWINE